MLRSATAVVGGGPRRPSTCCRWTTTSRASSRRRSRPSGRRRRCAPRRSPPARTPRSSATQPDRPALRRLRHHQACQVYGGYTRRAPGVQRRGGRPATKGRTLTLAAATSRSPSSPRATAAGPPRARSTTPTCPTSRPSRTPTTGLPAAGRRLTAAEIENAWPGIGKLESVEVTSATATAAGTAGRSTVKSPRLDRRTDSVEAGAEFMRPDRPAVDLVREARRPGRLSGRHENYRSVVPRDRLRGSGERVAISLWPHLYLSSHRPREPACATSERCSLPWRAPAWSRRSPSPAQAADAWDVPGRAWITIKGHGYGHGHGMSQYGAEGAAREGLGFREIAEFYYPGTDVGPGHGPDPGPDLAPTPPTTWSSGPAPG